MEAEPLRPLEFRLSLRSPKFKLTSLWVNEFDIDVEVLLALAELLLQLLEASTSPESLLRLTGLLPAKKIVKLTKNCEIDAIVLMPATIWQIFHMKRRMHQPETEIACIVGTGRIAATAVQLLEASTSPEFLVRLTGLLPKKSWNWCDYSDACNGLTNFSIWRYACNDRKRTLEALLVRAELLQYEVWRKIHFAIKYPVLLITYEDVIPRSSWRSVIKAQTGNRNQVFPKNSPSIP